VHGYIPMAVSMGISKRNDFSVSDIILLVSIPLDTRLYRLIPPKSLMPKHTIMSSLFGRTNSTKFFLPRRLERNSQRLKLKCKWRYRKKGFTVLIGF
jgi:hypothetical protein